MEEIEASEKLRNSIFIAKNKREKRNLKRRSVKIVGNVLSNSTMHGLSNVINSKSLILKIMWLTFLILCITFFTKFSLDSIADYLDYDVTTKIRRVYESPTIFPSISICNKNKFTTDFGIETIKKIINKYKSPDLFDSNVLTHMSLEYRYRESDNTLIRVENAVSEYSNEDKKKLGHSIDDFLIECKFDDRFCNISNDFVWYFDSNFGNCYKYNSGSDRMGNKIEFIKSSQPGKYYLGLKLVLFESMPNVLERIYHGGLGFIVKIENSSYAVGGNSKIELLSGLETNIAVERVYSQQLSYPYSDCSIDESTLKTYHSELFDLFLNKSNALKFYIIIFRLCRIKFYLTFKKFNLPPTETKWLKNRYKFLYLF